ncbi:glycosyltransferase [Spirulina major]|uniref:glycosyltransferase n=1 Tax=Spirulina major TaxID=270636 RepID=UPI000933CDC9|nr:glycosyltransferase [Spirulina major]
MLYSSNSRQAIALLALASPEPILPVAAVLDQLGWQVDIFTYSTDQEPPHCIVEHQTCRVVMLPEAQFVDTFCQFQVKQGTHYPLIHSVDDASIPAGHALQVATGAKWVHGLAEIESLATERPGADYVMGDFPTPFFPTPHQPVPHRQRPIHLDTKTARQQLGLPVDERIALFVGSLAIRHGVDVLLQAWARLGRSPHVPKRLILVDNGQSSERDRRRIEQARSTLTLIETVELLPYTSPAHLALYYLAADVCVIPSINEAFGQVAIEATAWGTPVIASDVGGLRFSVVPGETGSLVPPNDVEALCQALGQGLTDELQARRCYLPTSTVQLGLQLSDRYRRLLVLSLLSHALPEPNWVVPWQVTIPDPIQQAS